MVILDLKDRRIIFELEKNSRQSLSKIAKVVGLSAPAVSYRINKLVEEGIIKKFITIINVSALDYTSYRVYIRYQKVSPEKEQEIISYLEKHPRVYWFASLSGRWDLEILVFARNFIEFSHIFDEIRSRWEGYLGSHILSMALYNHHFKLRWLVNNNMDDSEGFYGGEPEKSKEIDETDLKILKCIAVNSRLPTIEIAKRVGVAENTVKYRIKKLKKLGIITTYRLWLDYGKLGMELYKTMITMQNLTEKKEKSILAFCRNNKNTLYFIRCTGSWDIELEFLVKNNEEYRKIMLEFRKIFGNEIRDYETALICKEHKINYFPMRI